MSKPPGPPSLKTPVQQMCDEWPKIEELIRNISIKWAKRTKGAMVQWPAEGSFDSMLCGQMRALIMNYKQTDKSKKRNEKTE